jgi:hypothetical protein
LSDVSVLIRRHAHEVRNALNGMELELTLLDHGAPAAGTHEAIARLRQAVTQIGGSVQGLSAKFSTETPSPVLALQIAERWAADARRWPAGAGDWQIQLSDEIVCAEYALIRTLLLELLEMAVRMGGGAPLLFRCRRECDRVLFEVARAERGSDSEGMGLELMDAQQSYWVALRRLAERNQGVVEPECLVGSTAWRLWLPVYESHESSVDAG